MSDELARGRRLALAGVVASGALAIMNLAVGFVARSSSVVAVGAEFLGDVLASSVVLAGLVLAARPADANHPYGHGRLETLAGFTVGLLLAVGGLGISYRSLHEVREARVPPDVLAVVSLAIAIVVRAITFTLKLRTGRSLRSAALVADAWNDAVDMLSASAALVAVALARMDPARFLSADHYGGFAVGLIVVLTGLRVARDTSLDLADTMPDPALLIQVRQVALSVAGVRTVEPPRARKTGLQYHVDLHVKVDPELTVRESHAIAAEVRRQLRNELSWVADVLIHVEPGVGS